MDTSALKKFAQNARRQLLSEVEAQLGRVQKLDSAELRESACAIDSLKKQIHLTSREAVINRVAYTWFNRLCALRFMDVNHYTELGLVSPAGDFTLPEILQEAKLGHVDPAFHPYLKTDRLFGLLDGSVPSADAQQEAYRLLLVAACNRYHPVMPSMFERIDDYTELLMPRDLLSESSVLSPLREVLTEESCRDVEVIGWLYQFYILEKKDEVFEGLKKNRKITPENIPAATQLFTPHWIVRYLVENSLGRLWMLNHPDSGLIEKMDYYIKPEEPETDFLQITSPEQIRICDPACGSGHMLTYAFDLLYAIYEEEGYPPGEIPEKIFAHNLYGIEIDERAGELAAFALTMKARAKQRRFFHKGVKPNICVLEKVRFDESELKNYMDFIGRDLFTESLQTTLRQFEEADNFGSLIRPAIPDVQWMLKTLESKNVSENLFLTRTHQKVLQILRQAEYLSPKYHIVVANPPYMGSGGMNNRLTTWAKENYPKSKSDLFAMFIERNLDLARNHGMVAMITMQSWMFLSSFEKLREKLLEQYTLCSMAHIGARGFDSIGGEIVSTTAFVFKNKTNKAYKGIFVRLVEGNSENEKILIFRKTLNQLTKNGNQTDADDKAFLVSATDLKKIPRSQLAYWLNDKLISLFDFDSLSSSLESGGRCKTHDDGVYVRYVWEVSFSKIGTKWKYFNKGGVSRKWYGNLFFVFDWSQKARNQYEQKGGLSNCKYWGRKGITWSGISGDKTTFRLKTMNSEYASVSPTVIVDDDNQRNKHLAFMNSKIADLLLKVINPTVMINVGDALKLPCITDDTTIPFVEKLLEISQKDWKSYEISLDFDIPPLLRVDFWEASLGKTYLHLQEQWNKDILQVKQLEEEINHIFIKTHGLENELGQEVPLKEVTLTCNPYFRYGSNKTKAELEDLLLADTMREFISYAVGCMFGRYSLDKPGLVLANQGETVKNYLNQVPNPTFSPDEDNVIPILEGEWFSDDITERFKKFLKITFGEAHYPENLAFIENAIGKDIRKFFLRDFYDDHVKRYKKRPIYWHFSSPNGGFNALIYMHRYRPDTVSVVLNGYLRDFRTKLKSRMEHLQLVEANPQSSGKDKTAALKEMEKIRKLIKELDEYESNVLFPLATEKIEIDLDDGVKVNYAKFGKALRPIKGLENED